MSFILENLWDLLPEIPSPDRNEPLWLHHRIVLLDLPELEGHPGPLSGRLLPDPDPLPPLLVLDVGFCLLPCEEDRVPEGLEKREGVIVDDDLLNRRLPGVAGILMGLVEDEFHTWLEFFEDGGGLDEDGLFVPEEPGHEVFRDREGDAGDLGHRLRLHSGPLEDEPVVVLRDLAHGDAEVTAPHRLVRDESEIPDQRLELKGFGKDLDWPDLHAVGEDLVAHLRRGDEEAGVVFVGIGDDFIGAGYRGGEDGVVLFLLPDIYKDGVAGLHPLHEGFVPPGNSPDVLRIEDPGVVPVGGGDPVGHRWHLIVYS